MKKSVLPILLLLLIEELLQGMEFGVEGGEYHIIQQAQVPKEERRGIFGDGGDEGDWGGGNGGREG